MIYTKFNSQYGTEFGGFSHWSSVTSNSFIHTCLFTDDWCFIVFFRFLNFSWKVRQLRIFIYWVLVTKNSFLIRNILNKPEDVALPHVFWVADQGCVTSPWMMLVDEDVDEDKDVDEEDEVDEEEETSWAEVWRKTLLCNHLCCCWLEDWNC